MSELLRQGGLFSTETFVPAEITRRRDWGTRRVASKTSRNTSELAEEAFECCP